MKTPCAFHSAVACIIALSFSVSGWAATPRDELLRLVPDDVGFCLVVQDLRQHLNTLMGSPFAGQLQDSPLGKSLAGGPELAKLVEIEKFLRSALGIDFAQLRDDILGEAVVFAYRPGPPGKPDQEQGVMLIRARTAEALGGLVERLNQAQLKSGELKKLEERQHRGTKYLCRVERDQPTYYCLRGPVLAFSGQETVLCRVIERGQQAPAADTEKPRLAEQLDQLGAEKALLALWLNPRVFEPELEQKSAGAHGAEAAFLKTFRGYWKALDGVVVSLVLEREVELNLAARVKPDGLPPAARKLLHEAARNSELWQVFPKDALLAAALRVDIPALIEVVGEFMDEAARQRLREGLAQSAGPLLGRTLRELGSSAGPDLGICVLAPRAPEQWTPDLFWAMRVRSAPEKSAEQALLDALNFFANLAVLDYNSKHEDRLLLKAAQQGNIEVKFFENDKHFPFGFQPAYAMKDGYLLLASSPGVIQGFSNQAAAPPDAALAPLLRVSLKAVRSYLKERRAPIAAAIALKRQVAQEEAAARLQKLTEMLQFVDTIELTQRPSAGQVILTLRLTPNQGLRK